MDHELIARGTIDNRSIKDVQADDVRGFDRVHFFAGIAGWEYALQLAGWPDDRPVWTGSCPCQPFSSAGKRLGEADERDLWPELFRLIKACQPEVVFGEQVASSDVIGSQLEAAFVEQVQRGDYAAANLTAKRLVTSKSFHFHKRWISRIRTDLEGAGYTLRFKVLGAHSAGRDHIRQRLFWVADAGGQREFQSRGIMPAFADGRATREDVGISGVSGGLADAGIAEHRGLSSIQRHRLPKARGSCEDGRMASPNGRHERDGQLQRSGKQRFKPEDGGTGERMGNAIGIRQERRTDGGILLSQRREAAERPVRFPSGDYDYIPCRDGKTRRVEPGLEPLVDGIPFRLADGRTREGVSRQKVLHGIGNAIVPQVAAEFIRAFLESEVKQVA